MPIIQRRVLISGRVQGVGFRASTVREASRISELKGFVRNLEDGRVEAVFQGEQSEVLEMVAWCKTGPRGARVDHLEVTDETPESGLSKFRVRP